MDTTPVTRWWHPVEAGSDKITCTLCPRQCHIPSGSRGFCFVRANVEGELVLTTYGRSSGFCIDPIEKKPLNHFLPGTPVLSFGTAGCNLGCKFCQNWDISKSREMDRLADAASPEAIVDAAERTGCRSIAFTYNDPVIWAEYAIDIARLARRRSIRTVAVTAGYISPDARTAFFRWIDAANVDLKAFTETFYRKLTQTHLEPVLDTLRYLRNETDVWFEITNLMIPGENDAPEETGQLCRWIVDHLGADVPLHFSAFHPDFKMRDRPRTPPETLRRARQQALDAGIRYAYVGNVHDVEGQSTHCAACGGLLIERDWYALGAYHLQGNRCGHCHAAIPGHFESTPGSWGRRREPVRIGATAPAPIRISASRPSQGVATMTDAPSILACTDEETTPLLVHARSVVRKAVTAEGAADPLPQHLADLPVEGVFVTLKRGDQLRACRGQWAAPPGEGAATPGRLGPILQAAARDAALKDDRFPALTPRELPWVSLEISVMFGTETVAARGRDRATSITVGRHGLVIHHARGRGLLLPQVATEHGWDPVKFLQQVCRKAGLPPDTWTHDDTRLLTFQARILHQAAPDREFLPSDMSPADAARIVGLVNGLARGDSGGEDDDFLHAVRRQELGIRVTAQDGITTVAFGSDLSLTDLCRQAARSLRRLAEERGLRRPPALSTLEILWQPIRLRAENHPRRHRGLVQDAVLAEDGRGRWHLSVQDPHRLFDVAGAALQGIRGNVESWKTTGTRLTAFALHHCPLAPSTPTARPPALAGQFYPAEAVAMRGQIEREMTRGGPGAEAAPRACRAVMLPHAGWRFCGRTIGQTLRRVRVPETAIILGPKHTPHGADWSITPDATWEFPGDRVPVATELADDLARYVPRFQRDADTHRLEHGSEVLIPFLRHARPALRVVPVVIGANAPWAELKALGRALADLCRAVTPAPLLVISSDMNHFAPESENRRLDHLALDAMATGDPHHLLDVVGHHRISMCGVHAAAAVLSALLHLDPSPARPELVDYRTSAEAAGDTSRVVGYAGVVMD